MSGIFSKIFGSVPQVQMNPAMAANPAMNPGAHSVMTMPQPAMLQGTDGNVPNLNNNNVQVQMTPEQLAAANANKSPLDGFGDLFTLTKEQEAAINTQAQPFRFNVDAKTVQQRVGQIDFTKGISPEIMTKINAGGPEAMSALITAMNTVGQQVMLQASLANAQVVEAGMEMTRSRVNADLPSAIRTNSISNELREDNPLFQHPAAAPMLEVLEKQMQLKFPNATAADLRNKAKEYLVGFAGEANKVYNVNQPQNAQQKAAAGDIDWSQEPII